MEKKWEILYQAMLGEILRTQENNLSEGEKVEWCFKISHSYWTDVKRKLESHSFSSKEEEICFYKSVKPKFTSHIEYFVLLNHALLFVPEDRSEEQLYWEHEWKRLTRFMDRNKDFVAYIKSGKTDHDHQYFLPENYDLANYIVTKPYESDGEFMTSHDHLVAMLSAEEMYREFVNERLRALSDKQ